MEFLHDLKADHGCHMPGLESPSRPGRLTRLGCFKMTGRVTMRGPGETSLENDKITTRVHK